MPETKTVKIERGKFSPNFQVARAFITAASAMASVNPREAAKHLDRAIKELVELRLNLTGVKS
jgi:hypothetical protein